MIIIFQILFILFSFFAILNAWNKKKQGLLGINGFYFWSLFWLVADLVVLSPVGITKMANHLGIGRGTDFILYVSLVLVFFILFRFNIKLELLNRNLTKIVREMALKNSQNKSEK